MTKRPVQGNPDGAFVFVGAPGERVVSRPSLRRIFHALVGHADGRRRRVFAQSVSILASILLVGLVVTIPLAYASPMDQTWIAGIYDGADDEDVSLLMDTGATGAPGERSAVPSAAGARIAVCAYAAVPGMGVLLAFSLRGPPAG